MENQKRFLQLIKEHELIHYWPKKNDLNNSNMQVEDNLGSSSSRSDSASADLGIDSQGHFYSTFLNEQEDMNMIDIPNSLNPISPIVHKQMDSNQEDVSSLKGRYQNDDLLNRSLGLRDVEDNFIFQRSTPYHNSKSNSRIIPQDSNRSAQFENDNHSPEISPFGSPILSLHSPSRVLFASRKRKRSFSNCESRKQLFLNNS